MKTRPGICQRKKRFASREEAERVAQRAPFTLRAYRCELCRDFHLTSRTKGMKTPRYELEGAGGTAVSLGKMPARAPSHTGQNG